VGKLHKRPLDDDKKHHIKYVYEDITNEIIKINIEIWKTRCKILYRKHNTNTKT
jgi:hypothetical protein